MNIDVPPWGEDANKSKNQKIANRELENGTPD
jgi:hypothetical protein